MYKKPQETQGLLTAIQYRPVHKKAVYKSGCEFLKIKKELRLVLYLKIKNPICARKAEKNKAVDRRGRGPLWRYIEWDPCPYEYHCDGSLHSSKEQHQKQEVNHTYSGPFSQVWWYMQTPDRYLWCARLVVPFGTRRDSKGRQELLR